MPFHKGVIWADILQGSDASTAVPRFALSGRGTARRTDVPDCRQCWRSLPS